VIYLFLTLISRKERNLSLHYNVDNTFFDVFIRQTWALPRNVSNKSYIFENLIENVAPDSSFEVKKA
jgi:hypothetical protein